ncbi:MAG: glycosyltransferase family 2 protein, partial [Anaerolineae bacterium]|nr:glycosyltransferase family 2 protein [Anaerolineae bacterium]
MNQAKASMNVVFNFHKGDQQTARTMLELLLTVDEGVDCTYYLQYGDSLSTLEIKPTVDKFIAQKQAYLSNEFPDIEIPSSLIESDPNLLDYPGNHTNRSKVQKMKHLGWNLCVYKYIQKLDAFLMLEPDSVVLKHGWLKDIHEGWLNHSSPIMGHLKMGRINGQFIPTHWAGSSVYDCIELRKLPLEKYFYERYPNPWWPYRNNPDTVLANNCFSGPMFSGYDISYDYFLFGLYWREKTDSNDPYRWPFSQMENRQDLIVCDFHSKLEFNDIMDQFVHRISLLHGIKRDDIREKMKSYFLDGKPKKKHLEAQAADYFPLVSVILCNFNYGQYIGEAIESVLAQSYPHFELLIVDDGSTDNSREVITRYANLYPDKIITIFKENGGQASAFNAGFEHVKGEIVSFLDSDDAWLPEKLELVVQIFREQDYAIVQHNLLVIDANSNKSRRIHPNLFVSGDVFNRYFVENHVGFFTSTSGISALRKYLAKVFPLDETWQICADIPLVVLLPLFGEVRTLSQHVG